jgi:putative ATP-dependent endonuclease of the OLD family
MRVAKFSINNFRGIRHAEIIFKQHPVLIGPNNSGKTSIIEALALLFGRDGLVRELTEHDFFKSSPQPEDRIKLVATISDFASENPNALPEWFQPGRAVPKWIDTTTGTIYATNANPEYSLCCEIALQAYFDHETLKVETIRYFHDSEDDIDPFADGNVIVVPGKLIHKVGFYLVRASRTWDKMFSWGSELFRRTVTAAAAQPSAALMNERSRLRAPENPLELDPAMATLITNVDAEMARYLAASPKLQLRLTNTDSKSVMDAVCSHYAIEDGTSVPSSRQGSGLLSLQGLTLLLELGKSRTQLGEGFLMALEEPEIHLPPSSQQQLVQRVQALSAQTITTTHSPTVAAAADPMAVLILLNDSGQVRAEPFFSNQLDANARSWERKFFYTNRIEVLEALMQPCVLVPEGRSEHRLITILLRSLTVRRGWSTARNRPFPLEVGLLPTEDANVIEISKRMSRLHPRVGCLVDGDAAGIEYVRHLMLARPAPRFIVRWNDGAELEDVLGWLIHADSSAVEQIEGQHGKTIDETIARLKANKNDPILYESFSEAISGNEACSIRAAELFDGLADACRGTPSHLFAIDANGVFVFQP